MINKVQFINNNYLVFPNKIISKVISFGFIAVLRRQLSGNDLGNQTTLSKMSSLFSAHRDPVPNFVVVREMVTAAADSKNILLPLKVLFDTVCYLVLIMLIFAMGYSQLIIRQSSVIAFGMLAESFLLALLMHFDGLEQMRFLSTLIGIWSGKNLLFRENLSARSL